MLYVRATGYSKYEKMHMRLRQFTQNKHNQEQVYPVLYKKVIELSEKNPNTKTIVVCHLNGPISGLVQSE